MFLFGCLRLPSLLVLIIELSLTDFNNSNKSHEEATRRYTLLTPVRGDAPIQNKTTPEQNSNFGLAFNLDFAPTTVERINNYILSGK